MTDITKTPQNLTLTLVNTGAGTEGGWVPGNGPPTQATGRIGERYVDTRTGGVYGPKTLQGWPAEPSYTLNLGNVSGEFANMLSRVPALEVLTSIHTVQIASLNTRANAASDLAISQQGTLSTHSTDILVMKAAIASLQERVFGSAGDWDDFTANINTVLDRIETKQESDNLVWKTVTDTLLAEVADSRAEVTDFKQVIATDTEAMAQHIVTVSAAVGDVKSSVVTTNTAMATQFAAQATSNITLSARIDNTAASVVEEKTARATQYDALSSQISSLSASFGSSLSTITNKQTAQASELEAYASSVEFLSASIVDSTATIRNEMTVVANANTSLATTVNAINVQTGKNTAAIAAEALARTTAIAAETSARTTYNSTVDTKVNNAVTTANKASADVIIEAGTRATVDGYLGSQYSVSTVAQSGGIRAVTGLVMSSTIDSNKQTTSVFRVIADKFQITDSNGNASAPFEVFGGTTYIKNAVIANASIGTLKIGEDAVTIPKGQKLQPSGDNTLDVTVPINIPYGGAINISVTGVLPSDGDDAGITLTLSLYINGVPVYTELGGSGSIFSIGWAQAVSAGNTNVRFTITSASPINSNQRPRNVFAIITGIQR